MKKKLNLINSNALLSVDTEISRVYGQTNHLDRLIQFYTQALRMKVHKFENEQVYLGTENKVLLKISETNSIKEVSNHSSIYHFAILYPNELELAKALKHLDNLHYSHSPTDHGYSKTSYITDPDGNTIELYIRTPDRSTYIQDGNQIYVEYADGSIGNGRDPLDMNELYAHLSPETLIEDNLNDEVKIGHIHIYASSVDDNYKFYTDIIGFAKGINYEPFHMADVGLNGNKYHMIAFNEWKGNIQKSNNFIKAFTAFQLKLSSRDHNDLLKRLKENNIPTKEVNGKIIFQDPSGIQINLLKK